MFKYISVFWNVIQFNSGGIYFLKTYPRPRTKGGTDVKMNITITILAFGGLGVAEEVNSEYSAVHRPGSGGTR